MDAQDQRPFYRSEAFPEDVADLVESATEIAAKRRNSRSSLRLWVLGVVPGGAALALAIALAPRLF